MTKGFRDWLLPLLALCIVVGCESEPEPAPPPPPPRVELPPPPPPPAPIGDQAIQELIDRSINTISANLPNAPKVRDTKHRLVLRAADPADEHNSAADQSARVLQQTLIGLTQNKNITRLFRIVNAPRADPERINEVLGGANQDDLVAPDSDEPLGPVVDDPRDVYLLSATVTEISRYTENRYTVSLRVEHPHSRQTVLSKKVQLNLYWDADLLQWREAK